MTPKPTPPVELDDVATAAFYASIEYPGPDALVTRIWANRLKAHIAQSEFRFLDAGCGSGRHLAGMLKTYPGATGIGIDISRPSLNQAEMLVDKLGIADRASFQLRSFSEPLPFVSEFDVVIASGTIHHTPDPATSFRNLAQVVKPGGLFACMVYGERGHRRRYEVKEALQIACGGGEDEIFRGYLDYARKYETWQDQPVRRLKRNMRRRLGRWRRVLSGRNESAGYDPGKKSRVFVLDAYAAPIDVAFNSRQLRTMLDDAGLELVEMLNLGRPDLSLLPPAWRERFKDLPVWDQIRVSELLDPMPESLTFIARKLRQ